VEDSVMSKRFEGRVGLVTGAARGMGEATVRRLAAEGAAVAVVDIDGTAAEAVAGSVREAGGRAIAIAADVASAADCERMVAATVAEFGALHHAVNNAGIAGTPGRLCDLSLEDWDKVMAVNLTGVFLGMKYQIPEMIRAGGGSIVNVASIYGHHGLPTYGAYTATKHGVIGLTRAAGLEYIKQGIRVNAFCPGMYDTTMGNSGGAVSDAIAAMVPLGRLGRPAEAAAVNCFLLSDEASFVNAADYAGDAGMLH
jgi:NAD(P)-dependent dehydrogenase (short-subunit alcohol dehydrogenase family)